VSLEDAANAVRKCLKVIEEAQDVMTARATGSVLDDVVRHAGDLLDIVEEALHPSRPSPQWIGRPSRSSTAPVCSRCAR
jgi:hypothetical protein